MFLEELRYMMVLRYVPHGSHPPLVTGSLARGHNDARLFACVQTFLLLDVLVDLRSPANLRYPALAKHGR